MSTRLTIGRLKASHRRTKRAAFCDAAMSSVPASIRGWLATNPTGHPAHPGERRHDLTGPPGPQLTELAVVAQRADDVTHVVRRGLALGDHRPQLRRRPHDRVPDRSHRRQLVGARRQVVEQFGHGPVDVVGLDGAQPARRGVHVRPAQLAQPDLDPGELPHHLRARHEGHRVGAHHDEVGQAEQQRRPRHHRPGRRRDHRHLPAAPRQGRRRLPPSVQGGDAVVDVGPARYDKEHKRDPQLPRLVRRLGQPHPVGVGDRPPAHRAQRPADDDVATVHAPDDRRDGADDPLADFGASIVSPRCSLLAESRPFSRRCTLRRSPRWPSSPPTN